MSARVVLSGPSKYQTISPSASMMKALFGTLVPELVTMKPGSRLSG